jgi:hypothetical protein
MLRVRILILAVVTALVLAVGGLVLVGGLGGGSAQAEPLPKVLVQHNTGSETNPYEIICISENALDAHFDEHEDTLLGLCDVEPTPTPTPD